MTIFFLLQPLREAQEKAKNRIATDDPHMIHVVRRLKTVKGRPWWEKKVIVELGLDGEVSELEQNLLHDFLHKILQM